MAVKPTVFGALHGAGRFVVQASERDGGSRVVVRFSEPVVTRPMLLGFIPAGPRSVMGIRAYETALSRVRTAVR